MFVRAEPDDPYQCQGVGANGQCPFLSVAGLVRYGHLADPDGTGKDIMLCGRHGGVSQQRAVERKKVHDYNLQQYTKRVAEFAESENVKTLRGEIGITRMVLESLIQQCGGDSLQLLSFSSRISTLVMNIERLVTSCQRLEQRSGMSLDKIALLEIVQRILVIVGTHINDAETLDTIANEILAAIQE